MIIINNVLECLHKICVFNTPRISCVYSNTDWCEWLFILNVVYVYLSFTDICGVLNTHIICGSS